MMFADKVVENTVERLIKGDDYREEVLNAMNAAFFDFSLDFFKHIVMAKMSSTEINLDWYRNYFVNGSFSPDEAAIYAGMNKKSVSNIYGSATKQIMVDVANKNLTYLENMLSDLQDDMCSGLDVILSLSYNDITVKLTLSESLIVVNALATKKIQLRGGAWSAIGKRVEKPLVDKMCELSGVPLANIDNSSFKKDSTKTYDREVDYKLIASDGDVKRVEVKLMGKGNPESADATFARDTDIFIADTLSEQNKSQLIANGILYVELRNNSHSLADFQNVLKNLDIPFIAPDAEGDTEDTFEKVSARLKEFGL